MNVNEFNRSLNNAVATTYGKYFWLQGSIIVFWRVGGVRRQKIDTYPTSSSSISYG